MQHCENTELVQLLIDDPSPTRRSRAHRELARRAIACDDMDKALRHYREASVLDPSDGSARRAMERLQERLDGGERRRGVIRRLVGRMSRSR